MLDRIREWFEERRFRKICHKFGLCHVCGGNLGKNRYGGYNHWCHGRCRELQDGIQAGLKELMKQHIKKRRGLA